MIRYSAFSFRSYQAAAFYTNLQLVVSKSLPRLLNDLGDVLDGDPITYPVPPDAPPEVPRILLSNKDRSIRLEISLNRTDVRWRREATGHEFPLNEFSQFAQRAFRCFGEVTHAKPGRIALVANRFQPYDDPAKALANHFCRSHLLSSEPSSKGPLNRPENFELHAHKRFDLGPFHVNSWVRCKTGSLRQDGERRSVIIVEQDLNTLSERAAETEFSEDEIRDFYQLAISELDVILRLYFPET